MGPRLLLGELGLCFFNSYLNQTGIKTLVFGYSEHNLEFFQVGWVGLGLWHAPVN